MMYDPLGKNIPFVIHQGVVLVVLTHEGVFLVISNSRRSFLEIFMPFDPLRGISVISVPLCNF